MSLKNIFLLLFGTVLSVNFSVWGKSYPYAGKFSKRRISIPSYHPGRNKFRGIWVATVENIDFPQIKSAAAYKKAYEKILDNAHRAGFNAIIFQVRPASDAFYFSRINPWSRNYTGSEGQAIKNFDPLAYMVEATHRRGMEFHAWLNPYRVCGKTKLPPKQYIATLDKKNFARRYPQFVLAPPSETPGYRTLILDPGVPKVREHIFETVYEIVSRYKVDAIHFDDYFYPYGGVGNCDAETFKYCNPGKLSLGDWRRNNVDLVIKGVKNILLAQQKKTGRKIRFGISPFGIWANSSHISSGSLTGGKESYFINYADTRKWVKNRWIDYIVPQLYWQFTHETAAYACLVDWWCNTVKGTGVDLYIGLAPYRLGSPGWPQSELADQMRYNSIRSEVSGCIMFSYSKVFHPGNKVMSRGVSEALNLWK